MKKIDTFSHYREGKSQMQRFLTELNPNNLELHDFDLFDWLLFANNFANHVNYFDKDDAALPNGNWRGFFPGGDSHPIPRRESIAYKSLKKEVTDLISGFEQDGSLTPHLTLFICFIKLLDFSKAAFNKLTKKHLDFYYNEILQLEKQEATPDKAYVIFELAKKAIQERIPEGTVLDAKKDHSGKKRIYKTNNELVANQAKVVEVKSYLHDAGTKELKMACVANTLDGLSEKLPEERNYWWPFGYNANEVIANEVIANEVIADKVIADKSNFKTLENAKLGFSIASSLFNLKEGERKITVKIEFQDNSTKLASFSKPDIENNIKLLCSGEKEWLSGSVLQCEENINKELTLSVTLAKDFPAVVGYNKGVLPGAYQTHLPVIRFILEGNKYYDLYEAFTEKQIKNIYIDVAVKGIKSVLIENDTSTLNSQKPYYPFTAQPVRGSNFYMRYPEMFSKKWKNASFTINWKNAPSSIKDHYNTYVFKPSQNITKAKFNAPEGGSIVTTDSYFKANAALLEKEQWSLKATNIELFKKAGNDYQTDFSINNASDVSGTSECIRLTLNQSALQDVYPKLYTLALTSTATHISIPNEPYIPLAENIELHYTASDSAYLTSRSLGSSHPLKNKDVQVFHEDIFGQYEKEDTAKSIVPVHTPGGELYIGLDAKPDEIITLLIQVLEGSENTLAETFQENENIEWHILSDNSWIDLSDKILINETKKFLESGILKFKVPKTNTVGNTRLSDKLLWIRAKMNRSYDAVGKIQGIYTQAVLATFQNHENDLSQLDNGLEAGSISKLITRIPQIKSVSQPYNSFDGKYKESDTAYYRRVSERLRHKNRAITQWDYEQLILQEFQDIFMVKCLNHTSDTSFMAPGHLTLVVVPDIRNKNAFDIYQPRVSRATLNKIQDYINELNTMHVKAKVINPNYREATIKTKVKFLAQYDEAFYKKQLNEDIKKYISPWAFEDSKTITFNTSLNINQLINYLEQLYYVDYIDELKVEVDEALQSKHRIEVDPKSILVSARQHRVTIAEQVCI